MLINLVAIILKFTFRGGCVNVVINCVYYVKVTTSTHFVSDLLCHCYNVLHIKFMKAVNYNNFDVVTFLLRYIYI